MSNMRYHHSLLILPSPDLPVEVIDPEHGDLFLLGGLRGIELRLGDLRGVAQRLQRFAGAW